MTTNLSAIAGPSRQAQSEPLIEPASPLNNMSLGGAGMFGSDQDIGVNVPGLSVGENGEVVKVPAFLNKLFSMVSDTDTDDLIYWAESGDSFFVPNHERFGKELLPRFFKHANFSSFVRQLNMYGFHKVPHLQSGVLKNESPSELWEFVNPFFKRNQPQLLSRVTRKNNRTMVAPPTPSQGSTGTRSSARQAAAAAQIGPTSNYHPIHLLTDGTIEGEAGPLVGPTGQVIDLSAIQSGINAIRQTQVAIGADLKALQASNEHLWREAIESRDRQQKHEETIDLIVSFLERLFGTEGGGLKGLKEAMRRGGLAVPRNREENNAEDTSSTNKRRRLLIGDGREDEEGRLVEISEPSSIIEPYGSNAGNRSGRSSTEPWSSTSQRFTALPTDEEMTPYSRSGSNSVKPGYTPGQEQTLHAGGLSPLSDVTTESLRPSDGNALAPYSFQMGTAQTSSPTGGDPMHPSSGLNLDPGLLQTTIGSLLQSPAAAQMFLNSLNASVQGQALQSPTKPMGATHAPLSSHIEPDPTMALLSPLPNHMNLTSNTNDLLGTYQKAAGVGTDVDHLQESIDSLVRSMGLDVPQDGHSNLNGHFSANGAASPLPVHGAESSFDDTGFNVDEFLDQLAKSNAERGDGGVGDDGLGSGM